MGKGSKMFGEEKIGKLLFKFSIPIILSMLISELYSMVDTLFVGNKVGSHGIGALALVYPVQRIIIALSTMIALGTSTAFSRSNGQDNLENSRKIVNNGFSLAISIMITLTTIVFLFREKILITLGASQQILPYAMDYLSIIIFGSTFLSLTIFISNIIIALGNNKISIASNSIGAITNVILDYILVVRMGVGVKGAAIATTVSQIIGFIYAYYNYIKIKKEYKIPSGFKLQKKIIIPIVLVGVSSFIVESEEGIVMAVLNNLLLNTVGDKGIIILGVITRIYMFLFVTMFGIASAMQPIAAYNVGARNYKRLKDIMDKTTLSAFVTSGILWGLSMIFAPQLISLFIKDSEIIKEAVGAYRTMVAVFPIISIYYVSIFYYQAMGRARYSILISVLRQLIIMMPMAVILVKVFNLGAMGVWLAYPISDVLSSLASYMLIKNEGEELNTRIEKQMKKEKIKKERLKQEYVLH